MPNTWFVYMLKCNDGSLYTGISTDLTRRVLEHNDSIKGAKYTRNRRPVTLVYQESCQDRSSATKREIAIKKLPRSKKQALISNQSSFAISDNTSV